jgi:hypothetical protein
MKDKSKALPKQESGINRWLDRARSAATKAKSDEPKGKLDQVFRMEAEWSRVPNTLLEDQTGQLWLAFTVSSEIDTDEGFEAVTAEEALTWLQHALEFSDSWDGDPIDICRLALQEIRSRPSDGERVQRAALAELEFKSRKRRS